MPEETFIDGEAKRRGPPFSSARAHIHTEGSTAEFCRHRLFPIQIDMIKLLFEGSRLPLKTIGKDAFLK
jgi:hypothetical protein